MSQQFISKYFSPAASSTKISNSDGGHAASRPSSRGSRPASRPKGIEISSSDSETLDGDEPGSKEVPASIEDGRKRKRAAYCGGQLKPEARTPRRESTPPQASEVYRGNLGRFQRRQPESNPESNDRRQEEKSTSPNAKNIEGKRDAGVHGCETDNSSTPHSKTRSAAGTREGTVYGAAVAKAAATEVMITKDSFELRDNVTRRKEFQAGVKAILRDDKPCYNSHDTAVEAGDGRGRVGVDDGARGGRGEADDVRTAATHRQTFPGGSNDTSIKGKGKAGGASGGVKLTPMEQQVCDLKSKHPGVLLLVECGYRFRFFGEDALAAAKVLRIYAYVDHNFHVASIPSFRLAVHLRRLIDAGYKVGVVRQAESAALKAAGLTESGKKSGTFKRELAAVFTQATWMEGAVEALMPSSTSNTGAAGGDRTGGNCGSGGKGVGQGSWRKIGGVWRRLGGGWGTAGRKVEAGEADNGGAPKEDVAEDSAVREGGMESPLPQIGHERPEQWLMSIYEEDASSLNASQGEPLSISLALSDARGGHGASGESRGEGEVDTVRIGVVAVDVRTGKVVHDTFVESSGQRQELDTRLRHLRPLELIAPGPRLSKATETTLMRYCQSAVDAMGDKRVVRTERLPPEEFCFDTAQASLIKYFDNHRSRVGSGQASGSNVPVATISRVLDLARPVICALGPLMTHLQRFGLDRALASPDVVGFSQSQYMTLDAVTLRDLEVLQCQADGREAGSLFSILDNSRTAFGRRELAGWVRQPFLSPEDIAARQDAVEELATDPPPIAERLHPLLRDLKDLEPSIASLHHRRIQPSRLLSLLGTMRKVLAVFHPPLGGVVGGGGTEVGENDGNAKANRGGAARSAVLVEAIACVPASMAGVIGRYLGQLNPEAAASDDYIHALVDGEKLCNSFAESADAEEAAQAGLDKELHAVRCTLRKPSLRWKTLRTGVNSTVEYLVELRKSEAKKLAPSRWMQVSQTKDLVRFHTPEVLRLQQELLQARESRSIAARQAWAELISRVDDDCYQSFRSAVQALGTLDALLSLATVAKLPGYVRPVYRRHGRQGCRAGNEDVADEANAKADGNDAGAGGRDSVASIVLRGARHPTVERVLEGDFVPNDVDLRSGECLVVTGPNMGGKSSTVRMVALLCIMGQMGSYVPADAAEMYCLDGVYTRMGAGDDLAADMSTFMVELWHTSYILKNATRQSLVVLDELGRGTSTHDGVAIALATLRHLVTDLGCATLFVTHYPQVANLASDPTLRGLVKNAHMSFIEGQTAPGDEEAAHDIEDVTTAGGPRGGEKRGRKTEMQGVTFLYRLVVGHAHRSYGLNVARAAGMDEDMIELAAKMSAEMRYRSKLSGEDSITSTRSPVRNDS